MNNTTRDPLAGTRPAFFPAPDDPADPNRRERDLRVILAEPRPARTRRAVRRPRLLPVTAVAAAAAAAIVAGVVVVDGDSGAPARTSAQRVLLAAADTVESAAATEVGRYWHTASRHYNTSRQGEYVVTLDSGEESWYSSSAADQTVSVNGIDATLRSQPPGAESDLAGAWAQSWDGPERFNVAGTTMPLDEVLALPTEPAALKSWLLEQFEQNPPEYPMELTDRFLDAALGLLSSVPTTAETRAATYRMLAELPELRTMDASELPAGTVGIAHEMRYISEETANGLVDYQLIIDPDTGQLVENQMILLEPGTEDAPLPVGTILYHVTFQPAGWVDTDPVVPEGATVETY